MKYKDCLHINISFFIEKKDFAKLMADHYWCISKTFNDDLTKKEAKAILKNQLYFRGIYGIDTTLWEGASQEFVQPWKDVYQKAEIWFDKNYTIKQ